jgi:hypothetical protein
VAIVTLATFKSYIRDEGNGLDDATLLGYTEAATSALNNACGRQWVVASSATPRSFQPRGWSRTLIIHDCTTITSVVDNGSTLVSGTGYQAEPLNHLSDAGETIPYYQLVKPSAEWYSSNGLASVVVTATWGWAAIPYQITQACLVLGKELCNNQDVRLGIVAVSDAAISGIRTNKIVRDAVNAYGHPNSIGVA